MVTATAVPSRSSDMHRPYNAGGGEGGPSVVDHSGGPAVTLLKARGSSKAKALVQQQQQQDQQHQQQQQQEEGGDSSTTSEDALSFNDDDDDNAHDDDDGDSSYSSEQNMRGDVADACAAAVKRMQRELRTSSHHKKAVITAAQTQQLQSSSSSLPRRPIRRCSEDSGGDETVESATLAAAAVDDDLVAAAEETSLDDGGGKKTGGRSASTHVRLRRQGLRRNSSSDFNFAVQSIRRGSREWQNMIKPFVSDLAFRSLVQLRRYKSEITFRTYTCEAAVLFVDLSGYSKITAAVAHEGAHFLSGIVNGYLAKLIKIIHSFGGDVVKFAGDAVLVVFEGGDGGGVGGGAESSNMHNSNSDIGSGSRSSFHGGGIHAAASKEQEHLLQTQVLCAAYCALEMQRQASIYPVEGYNDLAFQFHCGLTCGSLESEIFAAPTHQHMQRLYHSVGGETVAAIGELVDFAKCGQLCVDENVMECIGTLGAYDRVQCGDDENVDHNNVKILTDLVVDQELQERMRQWVETTTAERWSRRSDNRSVEEDFIHPSVLQLLSHGGLSPTQIAQMRNLCIFFIAMTSQGSSCNWLMEVQGVLDKNRCPIIQIIDDDKGVHIVAAINLYETVPEANLLGLDICRELIEQEVGCAIGMACGSTFCGVTGSNLACRWDITGPPAVRAARLMQYACAKGSEVAIDESVYLDPTTGTKMKLQESGVAIKGSPEPCNIYTLSDANMYAAFRVLETEYGRCHDRVVQEIKDWISGRRRKQQRAAVLVRGPPFAGKKIACQRAAGMADMVPFLHVCDKTFGLLQLARTIALWFQYNEHSEIVQASNHVIELMDRKKFTRAHDACIEMVDKALENGVNACFLVDRIQFLDEFSLSLMRELLIDKTKQIGSRRGSSFNVARSNSRDGLEPFNSAAAAKTSGKDPGRLVFLCVHVTLYNQLTAAQIMEDLTRANKNVMVPIVEIDFAQPEELRTMFRDVADMEVEDRWLRTYGESSGYCAGYFMQRADTLRNLSGKLWKEGKAGYAITSEQLVLCVPPGYLRKNKEVKVMQISTDTAMRFAQLFDELPPLFQLFCKVLQASTRTGFYKLPRAIMWEVLNDLFAEGVDGDVMTTVLEEMEEMYLVVTEREKSSSNGEVLSFRTPALGDTALDVCTPVQIRTISKALIERLQPIVSDNFKVPFVLADLYLQRDDKRNAPSLWRAGYEAFLRESQIWPQTEIDLWKEKIDDEIQAAGFVSAEVLGIGFSIPVVLKRSVGTELPFLNVYCAPVAFGPMGHSLTVISRNIFHEYGVFHGADIQDTIKLLRSTQSASERYLVEMDVVDAFLASYGIGTSEAHRDAERGCMEYLSSPAESDSDVVSKAWQFSNVYIPFFIESRLQKLRELADRIRQCPTPEVLVYGQTALRRAYETLRTTTCRSDAAQQALLIMASMNWKPREIPEYLPSRYYQTVARLRTAVLRRLNDSEIAVLVHQQSISDLEAFLVVTPLIYFSEEVNEIYFRQLSMQNNTMEMRMEL